LSLAQSVELSGAVVVTQPARVATAEARKAVRMFETLGVPVLGLVENMRGAFGEGAGETVCAELGVPFLGDIPFDPEIVREGDTGTPTVTARPGSPAGAAFDRIAQGVAEALGWRRMTSPAREPAAPLAAGVRMPELPIVELRDGPWPTGPAVPALPPSTSASAAASPAERRDLQDADLHDLLVAFYASVAEDPMLAPYFAEVEMGVHMPRIVAFWSTLLFHTGRYTGNAFRPHLKMPGLAADHFARWLATLEETVNARFVGERADGMKELAHRIAYSMQLRLGIRPFAEYRGED
jgi:hemoglobin